MTRTRLLFIGAILLILATSAIGGQILLVQRQAHLEDTIVAQRAIICDQAVSLSNLSIEIRPILVATYPRIGIPISAIPKAHPLPSGCQSLSHKP